MYVHMYSLICSGISMAFVLIVFTEPDGMNAYLHIHMLIYTHGYAYIEFRLLCYENVEKCEMRI